MNSYKRPGHHAKIGPNETIQIGFQMPLEREPAKQFVADCFQTTMPNGVEIPFAIEKAQYTSRINRSTSAAAFVTMFDGLSAELSIRRYDSGMVSYHWTSLEGGDCSFEDGRWIRVPELV